MRYGIMPKLMWQVFAPSFRRALPLIVQQASNIVMKKAHAEYKHILDGIPEFDKGDRFLVNILSASMLVAVLKQLGVKPNLEQVTAYYHKAMNENAVMKLFLCKSNNYNEKAQSKLALQAIESQRRNNPYSWKFRYEAGPNINSYTATFSTCGICHLFEAQGLSEYIPAMCTYDYDMAAGSGTIFTRQYTLAGGGPCCDCHYQKQG